MGLPLLRRRWFRWREFEQQLGGVGCDSYKCTHHGTNHYIDHCANQSTNWSANTAPECQSFNR